MSRFLTEMTLLMPTFSLLHAPPAVTRLASLPAERSSTNRLRDSLASVPCLSPDTLSAPDHSTSELLRTL